MGTAADYLWPAALALVGLSSHTAPATAQSALQKCSEIRQPLLRIPEIRSADGILAGVIQLEVAPLLLNVDVGGVGPSRPTQPDALNCREQNLRAFRGLNTEDASYGEGEENGTLPGPLDPMPGPTLRARLGDIVQLTFLNHIDPTLLAATFDKSSVFSGFSDEEAQGENGDVRCDQSAEGLPNQYPGVDRYPNCIHASNTANIHFHGTHTNPGTTDDNVLVEVSPSPRDVGVPSQPLVTAQSTAFKLEPFFDECLDRLRSDNVDVWPKVWSDMPPAWTAEQAALLGSYDDQMLAEFRDAQGLGEIGQDRAPPAKLLAASQEQIRLGFWPQYHVGAYPYCFALPDGKDALGQTAEGDHAHGHGTSPLPSGRVLQMGQSPGLHWYHAHKHGSTGINVLNGMTGAFVIEGASYDDVLDQAYGVGWTRRQPLFVVNQLGTLPSLLNANQEAGGRSPFSVNGRQNPEVVMRPGEVQLWRIVNTSSASFVHFLAPPGGLVWRRLAQDGVQVPEENYVASENARFLLAPGNRIDLLVKAPDTATPNGTWHEVKVDNTVSRAGSGARETLFSVKVSGSPTNMELTAAPSRPAFLNDIPAGTYRQKTFAFNTTKTQPGEFPRQNHTIDGKLFNGDVGALVLMNETEEWRVENYTVQPDIDHPFHIHINPFQIVEHFDPSDRFCPSDVQCSGTTGVLPRYVGTTKAKLAASPAPTKHAEQCWLVADDRSTWRSCADPMTGHELDAGIWWDVYPIPSGKIIEGVTVPGYYVMRSNFVDYPGFYVIHCHILAHEDRGMITIVEVSDYRSPFSHH